jgi:phosphoenolpyruvate synthase/pyruvate phosphate dikinase
MCEQQGLAISGGVCVGLARVVPRLEDAGCVLAGEVLVTNSTSPAWTPLFSLVCALVVEVGGMLSHCSVVARECGIPAVSQIQTATSDIGTGDLVEVNGYTGIVRILARKP